MMVIYLPVKFEFNWTNRFQGRVRKRKCGRTHQFNRRVGYNLHATRLKKLELDNGTITTNQQEILDNIGLYHKKLFQKGEIYSHNWANLISENSIRDARTPQPREIFLTPRDIEVLYQYKVQDTFRALSVI